MSGIGANFKSSPVTSHDASRQESPQVGGTRTRSSSGNNVGLPDQVLRPRGASFLLRPEVAHSRQSSLSSYRPTGGHTSPQCFLPQAAIHSGEVLTPAAQASGVSPAGRGGSPRAEQQIIGAKALHTLNMVSMELHLDERIRRDMHTREDVGALFADIAAVGEEGPRKRLAKTLLSRLYSPKGPALADMLPQMLCQCCSDNMLNLSARNRAGLASRIVGDLRKIEGTSAAPAQASLVDSIFKGLSQVEPWPERDDGGKIVETLTAAIDDGTLPAPDLARQALSAALRAAHMPVDEDDEQDGLRSHVLRIATSALTLAYQKLENRSLNSPEGLSPGRSAD